MKCFLLLIVILATWQGTASAQQLTFEQAWESKWAPKVRSNFLMRRHEAHIKASCQEIWDTAQANVIPTAAEVTTPKTEEKKQSAFVVKQRCRLFRRFRLRSN